MSSSNDSITKVGEFMTVFGQPVRKTPTKQIPADEARLRILLIAEELGELAESMGILFSYTTGFLADSGQIDVVKALDGLTDLRYVVDGCHHTIGTASVANAAFDEVHRSNMTKGVTCPVCNGTGSEEQGEPATGVMTCTHCKGHKVIAVFNDSGKIIKPSTYSKPNLEQFLK